MNAITSSPSCLFIPKQPEKHQLPIKTHQSKIKHTSLLVCFQWKRSQKTYRYYSIILTFCAWQPLTAQQLVKLLKRKDKKHFVRSHLTPMIKEGLLKYLFPEDENSPNQAYTYEIKRNSNCSRRLPFTTHSNLSCNIPKLYKYNHFCDRLLCSSFLI